ncbi:hypothetical protein BV22DRAFT_1051583 [Leucogyrophana mollusca]|uniref:Uncharacterized protein n=1 Tax=Leucogyrophana mollusca TaxID=85980 RepID=A0ACB8B0M4_9AGAM|nr:hypothetical protein BV22DRAFT_1051583 [Leucogyrophana mollusca]
MDPSIQDSTCRGLHRPIFRLNYLDLAGDLGSARDHFTVQFHAISEFLGPTQGGRSGRGGGPGSAGCGGGRAGCGGRRAGNGYQGRERLMLPNTTTMAVASHPLDQGQMDVINAMYHLLETRIVLQLRDCCAIELLSLTFDTNTTWLGCNRKNLLGATSTCDEKQKTFKVANKLLASGSQLKFKLDSCLGQEIELFGLLVATVTVVIAVTCVLLPMTRTGLDYKFCPP